MVCHFDRMMFREMSKELENVAKQQFIMENEINATILTKIGETNNVRSHSFAFLVRNMYLIKSQYWV